MSGLNAGPQLQTKKEKTRIRMARTGPKSDKLGASETFGATLTQIREVSRSPTVTTVRYPFIYSSECCQRETKTSPPTVPITTATLGRPQHVQQSSTASTQISETTSSSHKTQAITVTMGLNRSYKPEPNVLPHALNIRTTNAQTHIQTQESYTLTWPLSP